jgi:sterol 14-demethylase
LVLLLKKKYKDGRSTTVEEVTGLIMLLVFGGMDNSSLASTWTGARLLSTPRALAAVVEEEKQILRDYGDHVDYNAFLKMNTLHWSIKEAPRMHPPSAVFLRKVHKNFTVQTKDGHKYEIPRGHTVASPVLFNSHLPHIYKDPDVYDPSRFGPRREDKANGKFTYEAFSCGRHSCIGEAYAYLQIKVMLSHLLRNFELKLVSPFPETDWGKVVPEPRGKVMVTYKRQRLLSTYLASKTTVQELTKYAWMSVL